MSKTITIRIKAFGSRIIGPFNISDNYGNVLGTNVPKTILMTGISYSVDDLVSVIIVESLDKCKRRIQLPIQNLYVEQIAAIRPIEVNTASLWRHLFNPIIYNTYYGVIEPYIIEYPFAYEFHDEILQNVKDFTKAYRYLPNEDGVPDINNVIEVNGYFNKAILYNGLQSSGILNLVPKPLNNLRDYLKYPIYSSDSKTITYTKTDSFYQYNTFWSLVKYPNKKLFLPSCESLSIDKIVNQDNMDYGKRSFKKEPLRAKWLKVRHVLDNKSDLHLTSGFILTPSQISYK